MTNTPPPTQSISNRAWLLGLGAIVLIALVLRILGARGELWLDEVWSLKFAKEAQSAAQLVTDSQFAHDNNHILNTALLHWMGPGRSEWFYRSPSIIAGAASVLLAGVFAARFGKATSLLAALFMACSYVMIHYGSEARGYSLLVCFTMLSAIALDRHLSRSTVVWAVIFNISCIIGLLSHLLFVHALAGLAAWWIAARLGRPGVRLAGEAAALFAVPMAAVILLQVTFVRHMNVGGATRFELMTALLDAGALIAGAPRSGAGAVAAFMLVVAAMLAGMILLLRRGDRSWVLFACGCVIAPALVLMLTAHEIVLARYFMVPISLALILAAVALERLAVLGRAGAIAAGLIIALMLFGNARYAQRLLAHGRGHYVASLQFIADASPDQTITIAIGQPFRQGIMIEHYAPAVHPPRRLELIAMSLPESMQAEWLLLHDFDDDPSPKESLRNAAGVEFELAASHRASALGGWNLHVYRRRDQ